MGRFSSFLKLLTPFFLSLFEFFELFLFLCLLLEFLQESGLLSFKLMLNFLCLTSVIQLFASIEFFELVLLYFAFVVNLAELALHREDVLFGS